MASPSPDAVLHLAALHTLSQTGFASTSKAASLTLSTALAKYLKVVANACVERASLAGRGKVAAIDVVDALDDLGVRIGELIDYAGDQTNDYFDNRDDLGNLQDYTLGGLNAENGIAHLRLVPEDELEFASDLSRSDESMDEDVDVDEGMDEDEGRDVQVKAELKQEHEEEIEWKPYIYRHKSPDLSWLPPLPSHSQSQTTTTKTTFPQNTQSTLASDEVNQSTEPTISALPTTFQSIADRYRKPIPYSSSQLSQSHPFHSPPQPIHQPILPTPPSSLPSLISTYSLIASDPSIALRQSDIRRQATELLRQSILTVDSFSPISTLSSSATGTSIPPVKSSSIVPSHSDVLPLKLLPVNPKSSNGLLSNLVNQINSPNLPSTLKERLTSLRPPVVQNRSSPSSTTDQPIFYNDPVRGPDELSLNKFKGKQQHSNSNDEDPESGLKEIYLSQTWDSGPRGMEKWSKPNLPKGKKIIISKEGEKKPRMNQEDLKKREEEEKRLEENQRLKLRLPTFSNNGIATSPNTIESSSIPGLTSPTPIINGGPKSPASNSAPVTKPDSVNGVTGSHSQQTPTPGPAPGPAPAPAPGLKIKFGGQKLSISPSPLTTPINETPPVNTIRIGSLNGNEGIRVKREAD
ncbi:uncharacterized protein IL334_002067 [Kwoniella shivajii]|uniref:Bromodomain associated domain-containing protein n=1 Tax=Kwoniella shivajii TaxID=564305 RepID=A0ABZ1CTP0_9TREE|nr:hypothetical protein IL334_002067 [Kwoniella shivajii]